MSDKQKAIYIGNGVKQNESWLKSSFCLTDIPKEHMFEFNGKKYIKVNINVKDEADQYGKDVSITVDTWKPDAEKKAAPKAAPKPAPVEMADIDDDELPF
jgi:hypothetical protein